MSEYHDPIRQTNYVRQSLAQDKKPLGLFLSAGCPFSIKVKTNGIDGPLIPDIAGLTKAVCDELISNDKKNLIETVLSHFKKDNRDNPNIEDILSHIRSLRQVVGEETVRGLTGADLGILDDAICDVVVRLTKKSLPGADTAYHKVAAWLGATQRTEPVEIFTTNYDLLIEQALEESRVPYFDGFVGSYRTFFDPHAMEEDVLPARWARLWKLHGSVNWLQDVKGGVFRGEADGSAQRRVIHPSHLKYEESRRMPYLAMIDRLRAFIKKPSSVLVVCGYSFRDEHLNEVLVQGLQGNPTAIVFAFLFNKLNDSPKAVELAARRANLSLLAEDAAIIGTKQAPWLEKENAEIGRISIGVEWAAKNDGSTMVQGRFKLGDFVQFGLFLADLIGAESEIREKPNAE